MENYKELLVSNKMKIGVWGTGYIGISTMVYFAKQGVSCLGTDISKSTVDTINSGELHIKDLKDWFGFEIKSLVENNFLRATTDFNELISSEVLVHFIAIPTEKDGEPYFNILEEVINKISKTKTLGMNPPPLVIVESTLTPKTSENIIIPLFTKNGIKIGEDILYSVAPRRDWFVEGNKSLKELDRVFGGTDSYTSEITRDVLSIVCDKVHISSSHRVSEMVKSVENAYRHMEITLANQLSLEGNDIAIIPLMCIMCVAIPFVLITLAPRYITAAEVNLFFLLETILGPLWVWLVIKEQPSFETIVGGSIIVVTIAIHSFLALRKA